MFAGFLSFFIDLKLSLSDRPPPRRTPLLRHHPVLWVVVLVCPPRAWKLLTTSAVPHRQPRESDRGDQARPRGRLLLRFHGQSPPFPPSHPIRLPSSLFSLRRDLTLQIATTRSRRSTRSGGPSHSARSSRTRATSCSSGTSAARPCATVRARKGPGRSARTRRTSWRGCRSKCYLHGHYCM